MKLKFTSCLCSLSMAIVMPSSSSWQTTTPTPTPLPIPTQTALPSGRDLLHKMQDAVQAAGAERVSIRVPTTGPWAYLSTNEIDVTGTVKRAHFLARDRPPVTSTARWTRYERIIVGKREAFRSTFGGWICSVRKRVYSDDFSLIFIPRMLTNVVTLATELIGGTTVWHVRAHTVEASSIDTQNIRLDYYIDQGTMLLLRQDRHTTLVKRGRRVPGAGFDRIIYSNYGVPIHIALPKQCRAK